MTGLAAAGCKKAGGISLAETSSDRVVPADKMTYRVTPTSGDKVSLLGYGCMRWPMKPDPDGEEGAEMVDQEAVNELVDLRPAAIIARFDLRRPIYRGLAAYGHMGREELGVRWERTDKTGALKAALGL